MKSVQIRSFFWSANSWIRTEYSVQIRENTGQKKLRISISPYSVHMRGKYGPEKTPYLDTFHVVSFY